MVEQYWKVITRHEGGSVAIALIACDTSGSIQMQARHTALAVDDSIRRYIGCIVLQLLRQVYLL